MLIEPEESFGKVDGSLPATWSSGLRAVYDDYAFKLSNGYAAVLLQSCVTAVSAACGKAAL